MKLLMRKRTLSLLKKVFFAGVFTSFLIYFFIRIIFFDVQYSTFEEVLMFFQIVLQGGLMITAALVFVLFIEFLVEGSSVRKLFSYIAD